MVHTMPPVYTTLSFDLSHVVFSCAMPQLIRRSPKGCPPGSGFVVFLGGVRASNFLGSDSTPEEGIIMGYSASKMRSLLWF